jgi:hypothetical protein
MDIGTRRSFTLVVLVLALCACGQRQEAAVNAAAPARAARPATPPPSPAQPARDVATACALAPTLALSPDFADPRHAFAPGSAAFQRLEANFAAAYRGACARGLLRTRPLVAAGAADPGRLLLKNAPEANDASFYLDGEEGAPRAQRHMVLEFPFVTEDGVAHGPTESELNEAIFCAVHGATQREEDESGRCLPD